MRYNSPHGAFGLISGSEYRRFYFRIHLRTGLGSKNGSRLSIRNLDKYLQCWLMAVDDLFGAFWPPKAAQAASESMAPAPLAARMRPQSLDEYVGQQHILAPGQLLRRAIEADRIQSLIFYGPPGTGKTSLAQIIANQTKSRFERLSGVESNVADMRRVLAVASNRLENAGQSTILFVDEIHRFSKS